MDFRRKAVLVTGGLSLVAEWFGKMDRAKLVFARSEGRRAWRLFQALCPHCREWLDGSAVIKRDTGTPMVLCCSCGQEHRAAMAAVGPEIR